MKYVQAGVKRHEQRKLAGVTAEDNEHSVLDKLLEINPDYAVLMAFDMLFAGIDTVSTYKIQKRIDGHLPPFFHL